MKEPRGFLSVVHQPLKRADMKTLQELALAAVPKPGLQAKLYLVPCHPLAKKLEERDY